MLAKQVLEASNGRSKEDLVSTGLNITFADDYLTEEQLQDDNITYYIWDTLLPIVNIYKIVRNYHNRHYEIAENILLKIVEKSNVDTLKALEYIPYIHNGYISILLAERDKENASTKPESYP